MHDQSNRADEINRIDTDILIVGGGAAGMAAASSAASSGARVLLCDERSVPGGILPQCIHEGFGLGRYGKELTGPEYCELEKSSFLASGAGYLPDTRILRIDPGRTAVATGPCGLSIISFRECILATGCMERPLWALSVSGTRPDGIYTAGEAQELVNIRHMDIGKRIFVLGSGDIGLIMARRFTLLGKEVVGIAEKKNRPGGLKRNQERCIDAYGIPVFLNSTVTQVHGFPSLTAVTLKHLDTGAEELIECDTLITSTGMIPERSLAKPLLSDGKYPSWLHFAGNADAVHEIVDSVSSEAEALGKTLAKTLAESVTQS